MGKYNSAVITNAGQNFFAAAIAGGLDVTFTTMQTSTTVYTDTDVIMGLTSLTNVRQTANITGTGVYNDNVVQVTAQFTNNGVNTEYAINTIGIFAQVNSQTPVLVAVVTATDADIMPVQDNNSPSAFAYNIQFVIQNASSFTVTINDAGTVTVAQLDQWYKDRLNRYINLTVPIVGWTGSLPYKVDVLVAGITAESVPFAEINYPASINRQGKKNIDKAANLLTRMTTGAGKITFEAVAVPTTQIPLALRGY